MNWSLEDIRKQRFFGARQRLFSSMQGAPMSMEDYRQISAEILAQASDQHINPELANIEQTIKTGKIKAAPNIGSTAKKLLWLATSLLLKYNPDLREDWSEHERRLQAPQSGYWKQLRDSPYAVKELMHHSTYLRAFELGTRPTIAWGNPGSGCYYSRAEEHINIDFELALLLGFEHMQAIVFHEIGHDVLTIWQSRKITELRQSIKTQTELFKTQSADESLYKDIMLKAYEVKLRHQVANAIEDNVVNEYARENWHRISQDLGPSINYCHGLIGSVDTHKPNKSDIVEQLTAGMELEQRYQQLCLAIANMGVVSHGLVANTAQGWSEIGVDVEQVAQTTTEFQSGRQQFVEALNSFETEEDFDAFMGRQSSAKAHIMPRRFSALYERVTKPEGFMHQMPNWLNRLQGNVVFMRSVRDTAVVRENIYEKVWQDYFEAMLPDLLNNFEERLDQALSFGLCFAGAAGSGGGDDEANESDDANGGGLGGGGLELPAIALELTASGGAGGDAKEPSEEAPRYAIKSLGQSPHASSPAKINQEPPPENSDATPGSGSGEQITKLTVGTAENYEALVKSLNPEIRLARQLIDKIRRHQYRNLPQPHRLRSLLPEDGDFGRFDVEAHQDLQLRRLLGEGFSIDDLRRFEEDSAKTEMVNPHLIWLIDGSGSMGNAFRDPESPMAVAMNSAIIGYEASLPFKIPSYIMIWGHREPPLLAAPGYDRQLISQNLDGARYGLRSGTELAPAFVKILDVLANGPQALRYDVGWLHFQIFSDGDLYDIEKTTSVLHQLAEAGRNVTVDFGIISDKSNNKVIDMVADLNGQYRLANLGTVNTLSKDNMSQEILTMLANRMRRSKSLAVQAPSRSRGELRNISNHIRLNNG